MEPDNKMALSWQPGGYPSYQRLYSLWQVFGSALYPLLFSIWWVFKMRIHSVNMTQTVTHVTHQKIKPLAGDLSFA